MLHVIYVQLPEIIVTKFYHCTKARLHADHHRFLSQHTIVIYYIHFEINGVSNILIRQK